MPSLRLVNGACGCVPQFTECNGQCVDTENSDANCGRCGDACPTGKPCGGGSAHGP
jgi:hypothetical protein